ncbi:MAG: hypothetical protein LAT77_05865 [Aliidiomarina sp.]|uniref:hypothetical protein n=1 Tax=Aliidiomarina sp. TaxID=1872439 RepID=UPI0025BFBC98|nr:hypothetical protein [Aliidiomarina sp.]MCH8501425.1 hypothetical protein [Aliidiomarina sp.]
MQPRQFCLVVLLSVASSTHVASGQALPVCPPLQIDSTPLSLPFNRPLEQGDEFEQTPSLTIELEPGLLRPQLELFLRQQRQIQTIIWQVNDGHYWPTAFQISSPTLDELLGQLLRPYHMGIRFYRNHTAEIYYLDVVSPQDRQTRGTQL